MEYSIKSASFILVILNGRILERIVATGLLNYSLKRIQELYLWNKLKRVWTLFQLYCRTLVSLVNYRLKKQKM